MIETLSRYLDLPADQMAVIAAVVFLAGMVRGFSGFALTAVVMASLVVILPPVQLIPICFILEGVASLAMFRGGAKDADMKTVWGLSIGSALGTPIGLYATTSVAPEISKMIALFLVLSLTVLQLFRVRPRFIGTLPGLYLSGWAAGIVTGLAGIGGMVVALYVLASQLDARSIRGSLVMFLAIGMFTSFFYQLGFGVMNGIAFARGMVFAPVVLIGVYLGAGLFRPSLAKFYKTFCLILLVVLSAIGIFRMF